MELLELMMRRRSIRKYTGERVSEDKLEKILQAGLLSLSGRNLKPWEFILVQDKDTLVKLADAKDSGSAMLAGADCAIVVIGNRDTTDVWTEDCSVAMTYMHLMAAEQGVGSCWVQCRERVAKDGRSTEDYMRELLCIPENFGVEAMLSLGMPARTPKASSIDELKTEKIHKEKF